ncbi:hypothetical protein DPX16_8053 [Anabarilius grahami]|uniref:DUF7869 domain-containing protein n=1 Tax=Anabarilius grahami TaxID=495550 RepID=A0A3N0XWY6_ANAGA|nr:hypothetical protein DPX16_8053 [Anabarilius grahami]
MQNQVLPKSPISQTFCSRQLYLYVFGVVRHRGCGQDQRKEDIHIFTWLESENKKDSNMVASALQYYLGSVVQHELRKHSILRLFSDSCYGQNKNISVLSMLFALRNQKFKDLSINYTFPVRGHSFLPPDRVFGRLEQEIKKDAILLPSEYLEIMERHGNLSNVRILEICGKVGCKQQYTGDFCYHSVLKCGKKWDTFKPAVAPRINCVKKEKKADVLKLLGKIE